MGNDRLGLYVVIGALIVLLGITVAAVVKYSVASDAAAVITAAGAVVGTIAGAFFGVHVGSSTAAAGAQKGQEAQAQADQVKQSILADLSKVAVKTDPNSEAGAAITELVDNLPSVH